jgi:hypothetical protein
MVRDIRFKKQEIKKVDKELKALINIIYGMMKHKTAYIMPERKAS